MRWLALLVALLVSLPAWAAKARLQLDTDALTVGQTGRLVIYLVDGRTRGAPQLDVPDGVEVRYYGSSQRFQMDNFSRTLLYAYEYRLTGRAPGTYTLGPYELTLSDGTRVTTNDLEIEIRPRAEGDGATDVEVSAGFDRERAWEGQVVVYTYRLVSHVPIVGVDWRLPEFEGLRTPQHGNPEESSYFIDDADGARISVVEGAIPLLATGTGERDQVAALAQVRVPQGRTDLLGFRQYKAETIPAEPASLLVEPLPKPAAPGFSGLVGEFAFRARLESDRAAVGESVPWVLEVIGDGSLEGWEPPAYQLDGASIYENDSAVSARVRDGGYEAGGVFKRVVVPTAKGTLQLPPLEVVTFSPERGEYVTHTVEVDPLEVAEGREAVSELESFAGEVPEGAPAELEAFEFRPIYTSGPSRALRLGGVLPLLSLAASLPGALVVFGLVGDRARTWREARRVARLAPPSPRGQLRQLPDDPVQRLAALDGALRLALARHAGVEPAALDRAAVIDALEPELRERVDALTRALDRARFAGEAAPADLEAEVRAVVDRLGGA